MSTSFDKVSVRCASIALAAAGIVCAQSVVRVPRAQACGGFFCSQASPVNQSAEEIIFSQNADGTVTAVIRINYQGPSQKFAWVLPMEGVPDKVAVSANSAFDTLRNQTAPSYTITTTVEGSCKQPPPSMFTNSGAQPSASAPQSAQDAGVSRQTPPPVTVLDAGSVGPYDWEVIMVDPNLKQPAEVAVKWLTEHGYDVTDLGPTVLEPYLANGLNLLAFKLTKAAELTTGAIRPVMLTYKSKLPMIPIRPTAVASQPDMGILVYVLSDKQAVPQNYKSLVLNEALLDWFSNASNYRAVINAAADEAGGQGFVSEMAGNSKLFDRVVWTPSADAQWQQFQRQPITDGFELITRASGQYRGYDGWREAVCGAVTLPATLTCDAFGRNPMQYRDQVQIDTTKFMRLLYEGAIKPLIATQDLLVSRPYFTRMFTTMSPEEMTKDPVFDFNPDLADISNRHVATQLIECSPDVLIEQAPWRVLLPQGGVVRGMGRSWPFSLAKGDLPANLKIVELGTSGGGKVAEDNREKVLKVLADQAKKVPMSTAQKPSGDRVPIGGGGKGGTIIGGGTTPSPDADAGATPSVPGKSGGAKNDGCRVAGEAPSGSPVSALLLAAVLAFVRRRRA